MMFDSERELFEKTRRIIRRIQKKQEKFGWFEPDYINELDCHALLAWLREYKRFRNRRRIR